MFYRVKQVINGLTAKVTEEDLQFIDQYLKDKEKTLFFKLRVSEQYHSLNVAYGCLWETPEDTKLIKAALLHDVGKVGTNLTIVNKSLVVLAKRLKIQRKHLPPFLKKSLEEQLSHPKRGYDFLKEIGTEKDILNIVLKHHDPNVVEEEIKLLQKYDDMY